jgi:DNA-binding NtrC family response regulator
LPVARSSPFIQAFNQSSFYINKEIAMTPDGSILVVDDDKGILRGIKGLLRVSGLNKVLTCYDGRQTLDLIRENNISVVLLDLFLPHLSGWEILVEIQKHYPDTPVIIMTGSADRQIREKGLSAGAFEVLSKPLEAGLLFEAVSGAIAARSPEKKGRADKNDPG